MKKTANGGQEEKEGKSQKGKKKPEEIAEKARVNDKIQNHVDISDTL